MKLFKILLISGSPRFQARGGHSATYNMLKGVARLGHKIAFLYPTTSYLKELGNTKRIMQTAPPEFNLIPVDVKPKKSMLRALNFIKNNIISRICSQPGEPERITKEFLPYLSSDIDQKHSIFSEAFLKAVKSNLNTEKYDIIQVDYPAALKIIHFLDLDIPTVFVNHEIQSIRAARTIEAKNRDKKKYENFVNTVGFVESLFMKKYDSVIVLTETDSRKLKKLYAIGAYVSPHAIDTDYFRKDTHISDHTRLIFSGGENHYPNKDAIDWICTDILPVLDKKLKNYVLYITGKWTDETITKYSSTNVVFTGFVDDLREYLVGSISVAPLRIGGGMRVKILEAMSMECAVVSTAIGCEGLGVENEKNILLAETPEGFADTIVMLANNTNLYANLGSAARELVIKQYSIDPIARRRVEAYEQIIEQYKNRKCQSS